MISQTGHDALRPALRPSQNCVQQAAQARALAKRVLLLVALLDRAGTLHALGPNAPPLFLPEAPCKASAQVRPVPCLCVRWS